MKNLILISFLALLLGSCTYKITEPEKGPVINPTDTVSFQTQIIPIFNDNSNCVSCHKAGGQSPDLTPSAAYAELNSKGLVTPNDPTTSKIYTYIEPAGPSHTWKKYTDSEAQLINIWITQGANNN